MNIHHIINDVIIGIIIIEWTAEGRGENLCFQLKFHKALQAPPSLAALRALPRPDGALADRGRLGGS